MNLFIPNARPHPGPLPRGEGVRRTGEGSWRGDWRFLGLMWLTTAVDYLVGRYLAAHEDDRKRKRAFAISLGLNLVILGFFALFHGHAHGAEMPALANPLLYGLGFVAATATLHAAGVAAGLVGGRAGLPVARLAGAAVAAFGVALAAL